MESEADTAAPVAGEALPEVEGAVNGELPEGATAVAPPEESPNGDVEITDVREPDPDDDTV
jgi:hypothetical protein